MSFVEESSTESREIRQAKMDAVEQHIEEQIAEENERFSSEINDELEGIATELSYYSDFADKLEGVNGELSAIDHEYSLDGGFTDEITVDQLDDLKGRIDRVVNDTHGTSNQFKGVARAMEKAVASVTMGYGEQLL